MSVLCGWCRSRVARYTQARPRKNTGADLSDLSRIQQERDDLATRLAELLPQIANDSALEVGPKSPVDLCSPPGSDARHRTPATSVHGMCKIQQAVPTGMHGLGFYETWCNVGVCTTLHKRFQATLWDSCYSELHSTWSMRLAS